MDERVPKGFGGVAKQKGNRTRPYMVRVKVGTIVNKAKGTAYPDYKVIGYTKTRKDGILMLHEFHKNPYDIEEKMTFKQVYKEMFE